MHLEGNVFECQDGVRTPGRQNVRRVALNWSSFNVLVLCCGKMLQGLSGLLFIFIYHHLPIDPIGCEVGVKPSIYGPPGKGHP